MAVSQDFINKYRQVKPAEPSSKFEKTVSNVANKIRGSKVNQTIADIGSGISQTASRTPEAVANLLKIGAESGMVAFGVHNTPNNPITKGLINFSDKVIRTSKEQQQLIDEVTQNKTVGAFSQAGTSILMSAGMGVLAGTAKAAALMAAYESLPEYSNARNAGVDPRKALLISAASGTGTYITEKIGLDFMFSNMGGKFATSRLSRMLATRAGSILTRSAIGGTGEAVQENIQDAWQNAVKKYGYDRTQKIFENWTQTAAISFTLGALTGGIGGSIQFSQQEVEQARKERANVINDIRNKLNLSKDRAELLMQEIEKFTTDTKTQMERTMLTLKDGTHNIQPGVVPAQYRTQAEQINDSSLPNGIKAKIIQDIINVAPRGISVPSITLQTPAIMKESGFAQSVRSKAIENGLIGSGWAELAEFETTTLKQQADIAQDLIAIDYDAAKRIAYGTQEVPEGVRRLAMIKAVELEAIRRGDIDTIRTLATGNAARYVSETGSELSQLQDRVKDSPVEAIREINRARKIGKKSSRKAKEAVRVADKKVTQEKGTLKKAAEIQIAEDEWQSFVNELSCKY